MEDSTTEKDSSLGPSGRSQFTHEDLCRRLAEISEINLPPTKQSSCESEKAEEISQEKKYETLREYFKTSPLKFIQRYHKLIIPREVSCFNGVPQSEEIGYYIKKICKRKDMESRRSLDHGYLSGKVKNRRYRALQKMIGDGEYFSETMMQKRSPHLYQHYVGRYLTIEEREEMLKNMSAKPPLTLVGFFMEIIDRKEEGESEKEKIEEEEFETDSSEEEDMDVTEISQEDKDFLKQEFVSRMHQSFLDGHDRDFSYKDVDTSAEYDDLEQIARDEEDEYFDDEEPSMQCNIPANQEEGSEDELDKYMRTIDSRGTETTQISTDEIG